MIFKYKDQYNLILIKFKLPVSPNNKKNSSMPYQTQNQQFPNGWTAIEVLDKKIKKCSKNKQQQRIKRKWKRIFK